MNPWLRLVIVLVKGPTGPAHPTGGAMHQHIGRTLHDIETDLSAARWTQKRGPIRRRPTDITLVDVRVNALLDEWADMHALTQLEGAL